VTVAAVQRLFVLLFAFAVVPAVADDAKPVQPPLSIVVGGDQTYPPSTFLRDGQPAGFQVDVIRAVGTAVGLDVRFQFSEWKDALAMLRSGEIDVVAMSYSLERDKDFDFSVQFALNAFGLMVRENSGIEKIQDILGKRVAVQSGGVMREYLSSSQMDADVTFLKSAQDIVRKLSEGQFDGAFVSKKTALFVAKNLSISNLKFTAEDISPRRTAYGVKEGNYQLVQMLNEGLAVINASGELKSINEKWFGTIDGSFVHTAVIKTWAGRIGTAVVILLAGGFLWNWRLNKEINERKNIQERLEKESVERQRAEQALSRTEEKFLNAINNTTEAIALFDAADGLVVWNEAYTNHHEGPLEEIIKPGLKLEELVRARAYSGEAPEAVGREEEYIADRMERHRNPGAQFETPRKNRWFIYRESRTPEGGTVIVITDITDQKSAERKLELQRDELQELNQEKDKFFSIIAHDLKGPFNSLLGLSSQLTSGIAEFDRNKVAEYSGAVHESAEQVFKLLENLLKWSSLHMGRMEFEPEPIDLKEIIDTNVRLFSPVARDKSIQLTGKRRNSLIVFADAQMVDTIIRNLVNNAIKFTPENGDVTINARRNGKWAEVEVSDTGVGMSADKSARLFRLDEKTSTVGTGGETGTGLGLPLCKELVEKQGGQIHVKSTEGEGATFRVTLPLYSA